MKNEKNEVTSYCPDTLKKSKYFIGNKYRSSILEQKITYLAMLKIQQGDYSSKRDGIYVSLSAASIKDFVGPSRGDIYTLLKQIAVDIQGGLIGIVDDENQRFEFVTLINKAKYENRVFQIRFPLELTDNLIAVNKNFTMLPKDIIQSMKCQYSFPLYQLLKSQCFYPAYYTGVRNNVFSIRIGLSELKLDLGVVNSNESGVSAVLIKGHCTDEDYDAAVEKAVEKKYSKWNDFKKRCLNPAVEEINTVSDIFVEYQLEKGGYGGKVQYVKFIVWANKNEHMSSEPSDSMEEEKKELTMEEKMMVVLEAGNLLSGENNINHAGTLSICEAACYDIERIRNAYNIMKMSSATIENPTGWLISAIRDGYTSDSKKESAAVSSSNAKKKTASSRNKFKNFDERDYDYDELERRLLAKREH